MPDYGTDVWCRGDLRPDMPDSTGRELLLNDLANRLETAPGSLDWDPLGKDYGYDIRALVNSKVRDPQVAGSRIAEEMEKDDRVDTADVTVEFLDGALILTGSVDDGEGPFPFTFRATELSVEVLSETP